MILNAIVIIEVSDKLPEFIEFLCSNGFFAKWRKDNEIFSLPSNCVWKRMEDESENASDDLMLAAAMKSVTGLVVEFNSKLAKPIKITNLLVVPSNPWAALSDEKFGGWPDEETEKEFREFREFYIRKHPQAPEDEIKAKFKLL